jgi:hypothetical protein
MMTTPHATSSERYLGTGRGIIDVHSHALLPVWLNAVSSVTGQPRDKLMIAGTPVPPWSVDSHLAMMDANGIAACVLSWPGAATFLKGEPARDLARAMNEEFANIIARHPKRFGAFAVVPADDLEACVEEMSYALDVLKLDLAQAPQVIGQLQRWILDGSVKYRIEVLEGLDCVIAMNRVFHGRNGGAQLVQISAVDSRV